MSKWTVTFRSSTIDNYNFKDFPLFDKCYIINGANYVVDRINFTNKIVQLEKFESWRYMKFVGSYDMNDKKCAKCGCAIK